MSLTLNSFKVNDKAQYCFATTAEEGAVQTVKTFNLPRPVYEVIGCLGSCINEMYADIQEVNLMGAKVAYDKDGNGLVSFDTYMRVSGEWVKTATLNPFPFKQIETYQPDNESRDAAMNRRRIESRNEFYHLYLRLQEVVEENWLELFDAPVKDAQLDLFDMEDVSRFQKAAVSDFQKGLEKAGMQIVPKELEIAA